MSTEEKLLKMKKEIDEAKTKEAESKGRLKEVMGQLFKTFKCSTIKDAEAYLKKRNNKHAQLSEKFSTGMEKLEEVYEL